MSAEISELWEAVNRLRGESASGQAMLARIEEQIKGIKDLLAERCEARGETQADLARRVAGCEHRIWYASGFCAAVCLTASLAVKLWR